MFQFKTFPLHNQGPLWFIVTHPRMLYEKKILREKYTFWRTSHICCLRKNIYCSRKKYLLLEKKSLLFEKIFASREKEYFLLKKEIFVVRKKFCCSRKKIFVAEEKNIFCSRKIFVAREKNTCCSVFLDLKVWFYGDAEIRRDPICKIMSQGAALCRKIAPKRSFLTRLHPKGAHFKIMHRLLISKTLNWQQRTQCKL